MKNNKFEYYPTNKYFEPIVEAKHFIPNWYKKIPPYINGKLEIFNYETNLSVKNCMPFLDSLSSGFMVTTQMDIQVKLVDEQPVLTWLQSPDPLILRKDKVEGFPNPANTHNLHFAWILPCSIKTPKNYSVFFTHPLNRFDLPFTTLNAIIDGERGITGGFVPFFLNKDFEGIIPRGTPIAQIIPFKKENWIAQKNEKVQELADRENFVSRSVVRGYYKTNAWIKTLFEVKN